MKTIILFLLVVAWLNFSAEAATNPSVAVDTATGLSPAVREVQQRTETFKNAGYTDAADKLARQTTRQLLAPSPDKIATAAEADVMVDAHLKAELYYVFNTKWGTGKERDHRIIYDFLSQLDKSAQWTPRQREHFTILTVLSLAAQEYFWNEKSTIDDLQDRVRRELRYGDFKKAGHALDISNAVCLDDTYLDRIIDGWVNTNLNAKLESLMAGFKGKTLGTTYTEIVVELDSKFSGRKESLPFDNFGVVDFRAYDLVEQMELLPAISDGDHMCGEHSLFIPTDGPQFEIKDGNGRYKILRAILDNPNDHVARRLYLLNSEHMNHVAFQEMMRNFIAELRPSDAAEANELETKLNDYLELPTRLQAEQEAQKNEFRIKLLNKVRALPKLRNILVAFNQLMHDSDLDVLSKDKNFRYIIDAIIQICVNTETGGHAEIKSRLAMITDQLNLFDQKVAAKKDELEDACKVAQEKAKAEWWNARREKADLEMQHKKLSALEGAHEDELNKLLGEIKVKEGEATEKFSAYFYMKVDENVLDAFKAEKLAEKYKFISETLWDLITPDLFLDGQEAFSDEKLCIDGCVSFVDSICMQICELLIKHKRLDISDTTKSELKCFWDEYLLEQDKINNNIDMEGQLSFKRLEMAESLSFLPKELAPGALATEMHDVSMARGLQGWLECDSVYTQLWAILNNLNVFVFSDKEYDPTFGIIIRPQFGLITRTKDAYESVTKVYDAKTTGKHLATVILTSPTAKNVFLDKSPAHYNKFIVPDDYGAMARAQRHLNWKDLNKDSKNEKALYKYSRYPLPTQG